MEAIGEPVSIGGFSKMEYLLICSIVQSLTGIGNKYAVLMLVVYQPCTTTLLSKYKPSNELDLALFERKQDSIENMVIKI